jgi:hypothetical protein
MVPWATLREELREVCLNSATHRPMKNLWRKLKHSKSGATHRCSPMGRLPRYARIRVVGICPRRSHVAASNTKHCQLRCPFRKFRCQMRSSCYSVSISDILGVMRRREPDHLMTPQNRELERASGRTPALPVHSFSGKLELLTNYCRMLNRAGLVLRLRTQFRA